MEGASMDCGLGGRLGCRYWEPRSQPGKAPTSGLLWNSYRSSRVALRRSKRWSECAQGSPGNRARCPPSHPGQRRSSPASRRPDPPHLPARPCRLLPQTWRAGARGPGRSSAAAARRGLPLRGGVRGGWSCPDGDGAGGSEPRRVAAGPGSGAFLNFPLRSCPAWSMRGRGPPAGSGPGQGRGSAAFPGSRRSAERPPRPPGPAPPAPAGPSRGRADGLGRGGKKKRGKKPPNHSPTFCNFPESGRGRGTHPAGSNGHRRFERGGINVWGGGRRGLPCGPAPAEPPAPEGACAGARGERVRPRSAAAGSGVEAAPGAASPRPPAAGPAVPGPASTPCASAGRCPGTPGSSLRRARRRAAPGGGAVSPRPAAASAVRGCSAGLRGNPGGQNGFSGGLERKRVPAPWSGLSPHGPVGRREELFPCGVGRGRCPWWPPGTGVGGLGVPGGHWVGQRARCLVGVSTFVYLGKRIKKKRKWRNSVW